MAIQVTKQPGVVSFAGDPIIVQAKTNLIGKTFLRIKLKCQVTAYRNSEDHMYEEHYSHEVGTDGVATFNVGSTIQTALARCIVQEVENGAVSQTMYAAKFKLTYKEVYVNGTIEVEQGEVVSEEYHAIPGSLTEYERLTASSADVATILGAGRILSRKPEGEILPKGFEFFLPAVDTKSDTVAYSVQQGDTKKDYSIFTGGVYVPKSISVKTDSLALGDVVISTAAQPGKRAYVVMPGPDMHHFLFINGFGILESITATTKEALKYEIQSALYVMPQQIGFRANTQVLNYANAPTSVLSMSSGFVSREWAEWWINEFVVTRKAWILKDGRYIPVAIVPEETNVMYDKSKPNLMAVNFSVRYSFAGSTHNSFLVR